MRLQEYELQKVADAWDRWQERLQAERLKPLVCSFQKRLWNRLLTFYKGIWVNGAP